MTWKEIDDENRIVIRGWKNVFYGLMLLTIFALVGSMIWDNTLSSDAKWCHAQGGIYAVDDKQMPCYKIVRVPVKRAGAK
jgi:hypothetical protein